MVTGKSLFCYSKTCFVFLGFFCKERKEIDTTVKNTELFFNLHIITVANFILEFRKLSTPVILALR